MNRPVSSIGSASQCLDKVMDPEQFTQVIEAILQGKYSWACVLILRFAGYNPLHYIPYRTYNRLVKENGKPERQAYGYTDKVDNSHVAKAEVKEECSEDFNKIEDLAYLEVLDKESYSIKGGYHSKWLI